MKSYRAGLDLRSMVEFGMMGVEGRARQLIVLRAFLEALVVCNWQYLESHPGTPRLYDVRPRYTIKTRTGEMDSWQDLPQTFANGFADCKDLSCIRVAELRAEGVTTAVPFIRVAEYKDPRGIRPPLVVHHVQVSANGKVEDPSVQLGMPRTVAYEELLGQSDLAGLQHARWGAIGWCHMPPRS